MPTRDEELLRKRARDVQLMAAAIDANTNDMAERVSDLVASGNADAVTDDHKERLGRLRSELAQLARDLGVDANRAVRGE